MATNINNSYSIEKETLGFRSSSVTDATNPENRFPFIVSMPVQFYTQADAIEYLKSLTNAAYKDGNKNLKENSAGYKEDGAVNEAIRTYRTTRDTYDSTLRDALTSAPPPKPVNNSIDPDQYVYNNEDLTYTHINPYKYDIDFDPIFTRPNQSTTEIGGNDAVNCYWQFGWDDDLVPPMLSAHNFQVEPSTGGLGRVYSEMYDTNQQLLHISVGVPRYTNLVSFYGNLFSRELATMNSNGDSLCYKLGKIVGAGLTIGFEIIAMPFRFAMRLINYVTSERITRYVEFDESMLLYYRYVNTALIELAVNMGLMPKLFFDKDKNNKTTEGNVANLSFRDLLDEIIPSVSFKDAEESAMMPIFKGGFDLWKILTIRDARERPSSAKPEINGPNTNDELDGIQTKGNNEAEFSVKSKWFSWMEDKWKAFVSRSQASWQGADKFVSFKIEKSADASESLSNTTTESPVSQFFNNHSNMASMGRQFLGGNGILGGLEDLAKAIPGINLLLGPLIDAGKGLVDGAIRQKIDSVTGPFAVIGGEASVDVPEVWQSSTFSKSHSFNMTLRSPYGDMYSIFTNIYIPLIMLLCMALPRATGFSSYCQPFVIRAYAKGMFAIPYGIIESISIKRGASEFGWSKQRLPTVVELSFTIKDLSPFMVMGMDVGATPIDAVLSPFKTFDKIFRENTNFQEYLMTLSGMGLTERLLFTSNVKRRLNAIYRDIRSKASPEYLGFAFGNSSIGKIIGAFSPSTRFPD